MDAWIFFFKKDYIEPIALEYLKRASMLYGGPERFQIFHLKFSWKKFFTVEFSLWELLSIGGGGGIFQEARDFRHDLNNNQKLKFFSN